MITKTQPKLGIIFYTFYLLYGCNLKQNKAIITNETQMHNSIDKSQVPEVLYGSWTISHQENGLLVYIPTDRGDFPPARFRHQIDIQKDGKAQILELSPSDAHQMVSVLWTFEPQNDILTFKSEQGEVLQSYKLIFVTKEKLELELVLK
ncbi:MAG: hypothetical protein C4K58_05970 [Flavobacteriaceae bacterium]|nr:MAG: hypothetical protein C4K58_05970 [Flavobacteriaceae bacterium]